MNGFGTERHRPLPPGFLSSGWLDGNSGENRVVQALSQAGIAAARGMSDPVGCHQQFRVGPHTLDFAWPILKVALEADGGCHLTRDAARRDRRRDAALRSQGWLMFRVETDCKYSQVTAQVGRVVSVVRALGRP